MNGPEHFAAAEACLEASDNRSDRYKADRDVQQARVHAQLAGVALALDMARAHLDTTPLNVREWEAVTAPIEVQA